jgi:signal transduction histidine kinase
LKISTLILKDNTVHKLISDEFDIVKIGATYEALLERVESVQAKVLKVIPFEDNSTLIIIMENRISNFYESVASETSHEIKNAIAIALSSMTIIKKKLNKDNVDINVLNKMIDDSSRSTKRIVTILDNSRSELKNIKQEQVVELYNFFSEFESEINPFISEHSINLSFVIKDHELTGKSVRLQGITLEQILLNLIKNSVEAFLVENNNKKITIKIDFTETDLLISLEDNGVGVDKDLESDIFKKLYTTKEGSGSGLGLYLVRKFLQISDGDITLDSSTIAGATFLVRIPYFEN